jgi:mevalonate kinase
MNPVTFKAHGKVILTGEHAVIRGYPAIVIPNLGQSLLVTYDATGTQAVTADDDRTQWVFEHHWPQCWQLGQMYLNRPIEPFQGALHIQNLIPIARGCGFSAALSVITAKLLNHVYDLSYDQSALFKLSMHLEDHFHGQSSGVDVAGALANKPIWYQRNKPLKTLSTKHKGTFYLFDSQQISHTKDCVAKVNTMKRPDLDAQMALASGLLRQGLDDHHHSDLLISRALNLGHDCFMQWQLMPQELIYLQDQLKQLGALASKVTGAGDGGYLLAYFEKPLSHNHHDLLPQPIIFD